MNKPYLIKTIKEIRQWRKSIHGTVGFVPTMGALHEGHSTLLRKSKAHSDISVLSLFVNPKQFGPKEDFSKYPRNLEMDIEIATKEKVDIIFAPDASEIYPDHYSTYTYENSLSLPLCGQFRPNHFQGVTTVVLKLFNLIQPHYSYFGLKDAQQFFILNKMVRDLHLDIQVEGVPTVREMDGLAMSSRNVYLSKDERKKAPLIYEVLQVLKKEIQNLSSLENIFERIESSKKLLEKEGFSIQYLSILELPFLKTIEKPFNKNSSYLIAIATFLGSTRLIDNIIIYPENLLEFNIKI